MYLFQKKSFHNLSMSGGSWGQGMHLSQWALYISGVRSSGHRVKPNMAAMEALSYVGFNPPTRSFMFTCYVKTGQGDWNDVTQQRKSVPLDHLELNGATTSIICVKACTHNFFFVPPPLDRSHIGSIGEYIGEYPPTHTHTSLVTSNLLGLGGLGPLFSNQSLT